MLGIGASYIRDLTVVIFFINLSYVFTYLFCWKPTQKLYVIVSQQHAGASSNTKVSSKSGAFACRH